MDRPRLVIHRDLYDSCKVIIVQMPGTSRFACTIRPKKSRFACTIRPKKSRFACTTSIKTSTPSGDKTY